MILTAEGFKVTTASDGLDGVNKAKELKPDIILLDFVMPKMNGFQVCRILQKDEKLRQIPVILVTSKGDKVGDKFVNQLGVTGYITKPFQPEELVSKIHQTLDVQSEEVPVQEAPQAPSPVRQAKPAEQVQPVVPPVTPSEAPAPQAETQLTAEAVRQIVQEEISRILSKELAPKVNESVKGELSRLVKSIDKRIEKRVIEKMNEYIRRAKKK
jgi:DNA-binding response OmpR family regulator